MFEEEGMADASRLFGEMNVDRWDLTTSIRIFVSIPVLGACWVPFVSRRCHPRLAARIGPASVLRYE